MLLVTFAESIGQALAAGDATTVIALLVVEVDSRRAVEFASDAQGLVVIALRVSLSAPARVAALMVCAVEELAAVKIGWTCLDVALGCDCGRV